MNFINFNQLVVIVLQCLIVASFIMLLFKLRKSFGLSLIYVTIGVFQYMQVVYTNNELVNIMQGISIKPGSTVLFSATLFTILLIYIKEGAIETRKLIYGVLAANIVMSLLLVLFNTKNTFSLEMLQDKENLDLVKVYIVGTSVLFLDTLLSIVFYEYISKFVSFLWLRLFITSVLILAFDAVFFNFFAFFNIDNIFGVVFNDIIGKSFVAFVYATLFTAFLYFFDRDISFNSTGTLSLFKTLTYRQKFEISEKEKIKLKDGLIEELKTQKENLRIILNSIGDAVIATDKEGVIININPVATNLTGYSETEAIGSKIEYIFNIVNEYSRKKAVISVENILKGKKNVDLANHTILISKNGYERPIKDSAAPIIDTKGNITGVVLVFRDQSKERESIQKIEELFNRNQKLINTTLDAFVLVDAEGNIVEVNKAYCKALGYSREELETMNITSIDLNTSISKIKNLVEKVKEEKGIRITTAHKHKKGHLVYFEVSMTLININNELLISAFCRDITEQLKTDKKLLEIEDINKAIIKATEEGILFLEKGKCVESNRKGEELFGFDKEEMIGLSLIDVITEPFVSTVKKNVDEELEESYEVLAKRKDNSKFWAEIQGTSINYKGSRIRITKVRDITYKKEYEIQLINSKEIAEESNRLKSSFLSNMSHEIRTPMNSIVGFSDLLKTISKDEKTKKFANIILENSNQLLKLIEDVILFSRLESEKFELQPLTFNVEEMLSEIIQSFKLTNNNYDVKIEFETNNNSLNVITDKYKLRQVIINLVENALKYTKKGEVKVSWNIKDNELQVHIKDTGIGIDKKDQSFIFDKFYRGDFSNTEAIRGTGLGLSICSKIVNQLDGEIRFESELNIGSTFTCSVPVEIVESDFSSLSKATNKLVQFNLKSVLIVEDERDNFELLKTYIEDDCEVIEWAKNGEEAIEKALESDYSIILMDIKMPILDGYQACLKIKKQKPNTIIIAQTAFAEQKDKEKFLSAGFDGYIEKPIFQEALFTTIQSVLKK